ncbi:hypothetical protein EVAR_31325_1 [Eumeta japonica]|uniref:Uncharacterized protein n=1 Tax=Eumeta variegata TaxID=151549 RepID=A0A4C1Y1Q8_EUMVA|nr:hypothetical protein EVAR_31325_1 [Eumeta japonica]
MDASWMPSYYNPESGKDPRRPEKLRPITLLLHVAKTFERAMLSELCLFLSPREKIYGFCSGHYTTLQLIRVLLYLASEMNCGRYTIALRRPSTGCDTMPSSINYWIPHYRLHWQESSPAFSIDTVFALTSMTHYVPLARSEQKPCKAAAYPPSYMCYTQMTYRRYEIISKTGRTM